MAPDAETLGIDAVEHDESAYIFGDVVSPAGQPGQAAAQATAQSAAESPSAASQDAELAGAPAGR